MEEAPAVPKNVLLPSNLASPDENRPPPSPLSGGYLLVLVSEPQTDAHKSIILQKLAKAFLSWDVDASGIDIERELAIVTALSSEGDFAKNGERLIQNASEHLITEILINPQINTMRQCIRNLLCSFTKYRFVIHTGYSFAGNGSWILQDGTFSASDFIDIFHDIEVQRVIKAYENSVRIDICCIAEGSWIQSRINQEPFSKICQIEINPRDKISPGNTAVREFVDYLEKFIVPHTIEELLEPSDIVGNIRFSHPTLYVFPGGEGDAALFGINGFNMLVDGGFNRKACFWNFVRHLDRLDAVLLTRFNNSNVGGMSGIVQRKVSSYVYPQIGHFFSNLQIKRNLPSPDGDKDKEPLLVDLIEEGHRMVLNLKQLELKPHHCYQDSNCEPINLYHKVGHGKLDMYVISPAKDSREVKEFLLRWNNHDVKLFSGTTKIGNRELRLPLQNLVSICALLVWQPAKLDENVTRILFPGSTPQHKIFEGLEKMRHLEFLKHSTCSMKSITPTSVSSFKATKTKISTTDKIITDELNKADAKLAGGAENEVDVPLKTAPEIKKVKRRLIEKTEKVEKAVKEKDVTDTKVSIQKNDKESDESPTPTKIEDKKKAEPKRVTKLVTERKMRPPSSLQAADKKSESEKSSPTSPKKMIVSKTTTDATKEVTKSVSRVTTRTRTPPKVPAAAAKSVKDENNRKVAEAKQPARTSTPPKTSVPTKPVHKKEEEIVTAKVDKKPMPIKRQKVPTKTPASASTLPPGTKKPVSLKPGKAEDVKRILKKETEKTDSSAVSTPSTVDADAVMPVMKDILQSETAVDEKKMPSTPPKATVAGDDRNVSTYVSSIIRKEGQDGEEDDEILIIETTEIKSVNYEEQKYLRDEKESEKDKISPTEEIQNQLIAKSKAEFEKGKLILDTKMETKTGTPTLLTPEEKEKLEGAVDGIISTATEMIGTAAVITGQKTELHIQEGKVNAEISNELVTQEKTVVHASDEKLSTFESSSTTAPTMPEDEKVDDIKYEVEEKYDKEETKEKSSGVSPVEKIVGKKTDQFEDEKRLKRDAVKTPDEVADLPIYEEAEVVDRRLSDVEKHRRPSKTETTVEQPTTEVVQPEHAEFVTITPTPASTPDEKPISELLPSQDLKSKPVQERKASVTVSDVEIIKPDKELSNEEKDFKTSSKESIDLKRKESLEISTGEEKPDKTFIDKDLTTPHETVSATEFLSEEKSKLSPETVEPQKKGSPEKKTASPLEHSPLQDISKSPEFHEEKKTTSDVSLKDLSTLTSEEKSKLEKKDELSPDSKDSQKKTSVSEEKPTAISLESFSKDSEKISHTLRAETEFVTEKEISSDTHDLSPKEKMSIIKLSAEPEECHEKKDSITDDTEISNLKRKLSIKEYLDETLQERSSPKKEDIKLHDQGKDSSIDEISISNLERKLSVKERLDETSQERPSSKEAEPELHDQKKHSITDEASISNLQRKLSIKEYLDETLQEKLSSKVVEPKLHDQKKDSITDEASISNLQRKLSIKEYLDETLQEGLSSKAVEPELHDQKKDSITDEASISNLQRKLSIQEYLDETLQEKLSSKAIEPELHDQKKDSITDEASISNLQKNLDETSQEIPSSKAAEPELREQKKDSVIDEGSISDLQRKPSITDRQEIISLKEGKVEASERKDSPTDEISTFNVQRKLSLKEYLDETHQEISLTEDKTEIGHEKKDSLITETTASDIQTLKEHLHETVDDSLSSKQSAADEFQEDSHPDKTVVSSQQRKLSLKEYLDETQLKSTSPKGDILKTDSSPSSRKSSLENIKQEVKKDLQHTDEKISSDLNRRVSITEYLNEELSAKDSTRKDSTAISDSEYKISHESSPHRQQTVDSGSEKYERSESLSKVSPEEHIRPFLKESKRKLSITVSSPEGKVILDSMEFSGDASTVTEAKETESAAQSPIQKLSTEISRRDSKDSPPQATETTERKLISPSSTGEKFNQKIETDISDSDSKKSIIKTSDDETSLAETEISTYTSERKMSLKEYLHENETSTIAKGSNEKAEKDFPKQTTTTEVSEKTSPVLSHTLSDNSGSISGDLTSGRQSSVTDVPKDFQKEISKQDSKEHSPILDTDAEKFTSKETLRKDSATKSSLEDNKLSTEVNLEKCLPITDSKMTPDEQRKDSLATPQADKKQTDPTETSPVEDGSIDSRKSSLKSPLDSSNLMYDNLRRESITKSTSAEKKLDDRTELSATQKEAELLKETATMKSATTDLDDHSSDIKLPQKETSKLKLETLDQESNVENVSPEKIDVRKSSLTKASPEGKQDDEAKLLVEDERSPEKSSIKDVKKSSLAEDSKLDLKTFLQEDSKSSGDRKFESAELSSAHSFDDGKKDLPLESATQGEETKTISSHFYDSKIDPDARRTSIAKSSPEKQDLVKDTSTVEVAFSELKKDPLIKSTSEEKPLSEEKSENDSERKDLITTVSSSSSPEAFREDSLRKFSSDKQKDLMQPLIDKEKDEDISARKESIKRTSSSLDSSESVDIHKRDLTEKIFSQESKTDSIANNERTTAVLSKIDSPSTDTIREHSLSPESFPEEKLIDSTKEMSYADSLEKDSITKSSSTADFASDAVRKESMSEVSPEGKFKDLPEKPITGETKPEGHLRRDSIITSAIHESCIIKDESTKKSPITLSSEEKMDLHSVNVEVDSFRKDSLKISPDEKKLDSIKPSAITDSTKLSPIKTETSTKHVTVDDTNIAESSPTVDSISSSDSLKMSPTTAIVNSTTESSTEKTPEKKIDKKDSIGKTSSTDDSDSSVLRLDSLKSSPTKLTDSIKKESDDKIIEKETKIFSIDSSSIIEASRKDSLKLSPTEMKIDSMRKSSADIASEEEILRKDSTAKISPRLDSDSSSDALRKHSQKLSPTEIKTDSIRKFSTDEKESTRKDSILKTSPMTDASSSTDALRKESLKSSLTEQKTDEIMKFSTDISSEKEIQRKDSLVKTFSVDSSSSLDNLRKDSLKSPLTEIKVESVSLPSADDTIAKEPKRKDSGIKISEIVDSSSSPEASEKDTLKSPLTEIKAESIRKSSVEDMTAKEAERKDSLIKTSQTVDSSSSLDALKKDSLKSSSADTKTDSTEMPSVDETISEEAARKDSLATTFSAVESGSSSDTQLKDSSKSSTAEIKIDSVQKSSVEDKTSEKETVALKENVSSSSHIPESMDSSKTTSITKPLTGEQIDTRLDSLIKPSSEETAPTNKCFSDVTEVIKVEKSSQLSSKETDDSADQIASFQLKSSEETTPAKPTEYRKDSTVKSIAEEKLSRITKTSPSESLRKDSITKISPDNDIKSEIESTKKSDSETLIPSGSLIFDTSEKDLHQVTFSETDSTTHTKFDTSTEKTFRKDSITKSSLDEKKCDLPEGSVTFQSTNKNVLQKDSFTKPTLEEKESFIQKYSTTENLEIISKQGKDSLVERFSAADETHSGEIRKASPTKSTEESKVSSDILRNDFPTQISTEEKYFPVGSEQDEKSLKRSSISQSFEKKEEESRKRASISDLQENIPLKRGSLSRSSLESDTKEHFGQKICAESQENLTSIISFAESQTATQKSPERPEDLQKDLLPPDTKLRDSFSLQETLAKDTKPASTELQDIAAAKKEIFLETLEAKMSPSEIKEREIYEKTDTLSTDSVKICQSHDHKTDSSEETKLKSKMPLTRVTSKGDPETVEKISPSSDTSESDKFSKSDSISVCTEKLVSNEDQIQSDFEKSVSTDSKQDKLSTLDKSGISEDLESHEQIESVISQSKITSENAYEKTKKLSSEDVKVQELQSSITGSKSEKEISLTEVTDQKADSMVEEEPKIAGETITKSSFQQDTKLFEETIEKEKITHSEFFEESSCIYEGKSQPDTKVQHPQGIKTEETKMQEQEKFEKFIKTELKSNESATLSFETADSTKVQEDELSKITSSKSLTSESSKVESEVTATDFKYLKSTSPTKQKECSGKSSIHECSDEFFDAESSKITSTEECQKTCLEAETKNQKISEEMSKRDSISSISFESEAIRKPSIESIKTDSTPQQHHSFLDSEFEKVKSETEIERSSFSKSDQICDSQKIYSETVMKTSLYEDTTDTLDVDDNIKSSKTIPTTITSSTVTTELPLSSPHTISTVQSEAASLKDTELIKTAEYHTTSTIISSELRGSESSSQYTRETAVDQGRLKDDVDVTTTRKHSITTESGTTKPVSKSSDVTQSVSIKQKGLVSEGKTLHKPAEKCVSEPLKSTEKIYHEEKSDKLGKQESCPEGDDDIRPDNEIKSKEPEKTQSASSSWKSPSNIVTSIFSSVVSTAGDLKDQVLSTTLGSGKSSTITSEKTETAMTENIESKTEKLTTMEKHIGEKAKVHSDTAEDGQKSLSSEPVTKEDKQQTFETKSYAATTEVSSKDEVSTKVTVVEGLTRSMPDSSLTTSTFSSISPTGADRSGKAGSFAERGHQLTSPELHIDASQLCARFTNDKKDDEEAKRFALKCKSSSEEFYDVSSADTVGDLNLKFEKKEQVSKTISLPILDEKFEDSSKTSGDVEKGDDFSRSYPYLEKISSSESRTPTNLSDPSLNKQVERELQSKSVSLPVIKRPDDSEKYMTLPHLYKTTNLEDLTSATITPAMTSSIIEDDDTVETHLFGKRTDVKQQAIKETEDEDHEQSVRTARRGTIPDDKDLHESDFSKPSHVVHRTVTDVTRKTSSGGSCELEHDTIADDGTEDERPLSPRSDASTGQLSRGRQDSQLYESDDEMVESTFSASSNIGHFKEDDDIQSQLASLQKEASRRISASMTQSFYGSFPSSDDEDEGEKKSDTKQQGSSDKKIVENVKADAAPSTKVEEKEKEDPIRDWGSPMRLPEPRKNGSFLVWNPFREWGRPMGLPSPGPQRKDSNGDIEINLTPINAKGTPKRTVKKTNDKNVTGTDSSRQKDVSSKKSKQTKPVVPLYVDLAYVPHHGNPYYTNVEFFKRIRARYYVFSGTDPSKDVFNALLEGKKSWENQDLEVTIISTYDTDVLGFWITENEETLANLKIDLAPSASRCTINLQDHDTSCSAYRLEF